METVNKKIPASFVALCVQRFSFFLYDCFLFMVNTGAFFFFTEHV